MPTERAIVLAAGKGTRMKSDRPKVVHEIAGRSLLGHVLAMLARAAPEPGGTAPDVTVIVGAGDAGAAVAAEARVWAPEASIAVQTSQSGTADAVAAARSDLAGFDGTVFVLFADTPLVRAETLQAMRGELEAGAGVVVLAFEAVDPTGYGRVVVDETGAVSAIVEHKDADPAQREITLCNSGVMAFRVADLVGLLDRIGADNAQGEFYLTDAVALARADGLDVKVAICPEREVMGINARSQLA
ncbi:MAG: NTP transferase domain-containing protein, partial [Pseudomonadota bacterium]